MGWLNSITSLVKSKSGTSKTSYQSLAEVRLALREAGLESSQLIVGVDFTRSNEWQGESSFSGQSLHSISSRFLNPYEEAILIIGKTLQPYDDDQRIPCYGFGDLTSKDRYVFSFWPNDEPGDGLGSVIHRYRELVKHVKLCGPTSFAPLIKQAMQIVSGSNQQYHVLLILADGQVSDHCRQETVAAIVEASKYPLSIIVVGVGDGPWHDMESFLRGIPSRRFSNFQFVDFTGIMEQSTNLADGRINVEEREAHFALHALRCIPSQYRAIQGLGLLRSAARLPAAQPPLPPPLPLGPLAAHLRTGGGAAAAAAAATAELNSGGLSLDLSSPQRPRVPFSFLPDPANSSTGEDEDQDCLNHRV